MGRARAAVADLEVPVNTVLVGQSALLDLAIERVQVDDFAFVRNSLTVEVEVRGRGFEGRTVPVTLSREGQPVATKNVTLRGEEPVKVAFTFTPDQTGRFVYTVETPVFPREAVVENNTRAFTLKVIRDRVRVLLVVGRPSWDERFLRGLLKQDANVDLVSFYILRTMADEPNVTNPPRELSLIPFPMDEIFRQKLSHVRRRDPAELRLLQPRPLHRRLRAGPGGLREGGRLAGLHRRGLRCSAPGRGTSPACRRCCRWRAWARPTCSPSWRG